MLQKAIKQQKQPRSQWKVAIDNVAAAAAAALCTTLCRQRYPCVFVDSFSVVFSLEHAAWLAKGPKTRMGPPGIERPSIVHHEGARTFANDSVG
jgi:hypothetical protein